MQNKTFTIDELLVWLNAEDRLLKTINYAHLTFWLQSRRIPRTAKIEGKNMYDLKTAEDVAELIRAFQLVKSSIQWRPDRGRRQREAAAQTINVPI